MTVKKLQIKAKKRKENKIEAKFSHRDGRMTWNVSLQVDGAMWLAFGYEYNQGEDSFGVAKDEGYELVLGAVTEKAEGLNN